MRNWRTVVGAMCIVVAMVLVAFTGLTYGRQADVGAAPDVGTRGEDRRLMRAFDDAVDPLQPDQHGPAAAVGQGIEPAPAEVSTDGPVVKTVTQEELRESLRESSVSLVQTKDGSITARRSDEGTRSHWVGGEIDAGGPYGGPDTFEGGPAITFTVQVFDPSIIFFRWDFNNDGVFDFPDQAGAGPLGKWTTATSTSKRFLDNVFGDIVVQGWDGVSTIVEFNTGDNGVSSYSIQYLIGYGTYTFGERFTAKVNMKATTLGHYHYAYTLFETGIWSASTGALLGQCTAPHMTFSWNWCTLPSPVNLVVGQDYVMGVRTTSYGNLVSQIGDTDKVHWVGLYYCYSSSLCYPSTSFSPAYTLMMDFTWEETIIRPDAARDTASIEVNNVAPIVSNVVTNPSPALEGSPTQFLADFADPGTDDTWEYRWRFHDGEVSPWLPVSKFDGGAKVWMVDTLGPDGPGLQSALIAKCGNFCTKFDRMDWNDQIGEGRVPTLAEFLQYDIVVMASNYFNLGGTTQMGNRLADYADAGGNVIMMQFNHDNYWGCYVGICGRWESDEYSPIPRGYSYGSSGSMGTIYVPGHPLLDGVSALTTNAYAANIYSTTSGATRIVDWNNGRVLAAVKTNPIVDNGARAVALNFFPLASYGGVGGDYLQLIVNAIRWASRQPDPTVKSMPITLDAYEKTYRDDDPVTTTPEDSFPVSVEVRDDDHNKIAVVSKTQLTFQNFEIAAQCTGQYYLTNTWPPGWSSSPNPYGWVCNANSYGRGRSPYILYYFNDPLYGTGNGHSYLYMPAMDLSAYVGIQFDFYTYWQANYPAGNQNGFVQASTDGGTTWPITLKSYHHNNPATLQGDVSLQNVDVGGQSNVRIRFYYQSADDWWWAVDNVRVTGLVGTIMQGLGSGAGVASVANVPPSISGGFDSAVRAESQSLLFDGFSLSDPALIEPTEWFAYRMNFDDGTPASWVYKGSLAPPRFSVLVIHSTCLGGIDATCPYYNDLRDKLLAQDDVASVTGWNFLNYAGTYIPTAPPLSTMLLYDVIVFATYYAYLAYSPWELAKRTVGDRMAAYLDAGRGGVLTMMSSYGLSGGFESWALSGRYRDDEYGAFEKPVERIQAPIAGLDMLVPDHEIFTRVGSDVGCVFDHDAANVPLSKGGRGQAAGTVGTLLARWSDGGVAVGVKTLNNGMRTAHFGGFQSTTGADSGMLLRNLIGWVAGGLPSPKIPSFTYTWGDNGVYTVDISVIDDDMGFVWDPATNSPIQVLTGPGTGFAHRFVTVSVDNVDPTIDSSSIRAYILADFHLKVGGKKWKTVTMDVFDEGVKVGSLTAVRPTDPKGPKEVIKTLSMVRVDVLRQDTPQEFTVVVSFTPADGVTSGKTPVWVTVHPTRTPLKKDDPKYSMITYNIEFDAKRTTPEWTQTLVFDDLRTDLLFMKHVRFKIHKDHVHAHIHPDKCRDINDVTKLKKLDLDRKIEDTVFIDFEARAYDPGTDDVAFAWLWGDPASLIRIKVPGPDIKDLNADLVQMFHNDGSRMTEGLLGNAQLLGFSEPFFDRGTNTGKSPLGTSGVWAHSSTYHSFVRESKDDKIIGRYYWVLLVVLDDDNGRGYPSTFGTDGIDIEFMELDLTCRGTL